MSGLSPRTSSRAAGLIGSRRHGHLTRGDGGAVPRGQTRCAARPPAVCAASPYKSTELLASLATTRLRKCKKGRTLGASGVSWAV